MPTNKDNLSPDTSSTPTIEKFPRLTSYKCYYKDSGNLAMILIINKECTPEYLNKELFKGTNVFCTQEPSAIANEGLLKQ